MILCINTGSIFFSKHLVANVWRNACGCKCLNSTGARFSRIALLYSFILMFFTTLFRSWTITYLVTGEPTVLVNTRSPNSGFALQRFPNLCLYSSCFFFQFFKHASVSPKKGISRYEFAVYGVVSSSIFFPSW